MGELEKTTALARSEDRSQVAFAPEGQGDLFGARAAAHAVVDEGGARAASEASNAGLSDDERAILAAVGSEPVHPDAIASEVGLPFGRVASALLTLCLEHVLVEVLPGLYRRKSA
ncbi:hypothetical protein EON77_13140 [bacterium]|nr:MAG: hypothetical protein EON77_13140 [bacterium]